MQKSSPVHKINNHRQNLLFSRVRRLSYNRGDIETHLLKKQKKFVFIRELHKIISVEGNREVPENQTSAYPADSDIQDVNGMRLTEQEVPEHTLDFYRM